MYCFGDGTVEQTEKQAVLMSWDLDIFRQ